MNTHLSRKARTVSIVCLYVQASTARTAKAAMDIMRSVDERARKFAEARAKKLEIDRATSETLVELAETSSHVCICHCIYLEMTHIPTNQSFSIGYG